MKLSRRNFLALSMGGAGTAFLSRWTHSRLTLSTPALAAPEIYRSSHGLLEVTLTAALTPVQLGRRRVHLLTYNGQIPGPRLEVNPGDTVRIHFQNRLDRPSNLHYHGLHLPPTGKADNPFLMVEPGQDFTYEFTVFPQQRSGLFWYHPHHHGMTGPQVGGGLAGPLVVRGELDQIPELKAAQEVITVLQDFDLDRQGNLNPRPANIMMGREGTDISLSGSLNPTIPLAAGGLLRWRILNASASRFYRLSLEDHPFYLIATDGGAIEAPVKMSELLLAPGERSEVLIQGDRPPGTYRLLNLPYDRGGKTQSGSMMMPSSAPPSTAPQPIAIVQYQGKTTPLPLPQSLLPVEALPPADRTRRIEIAMAMNMGMNMGMDGMNMDMGMDHSGMDHGEMNHGGMIHGDSMNMGDGMAGDGNMMMFTFNGQAYDPDRIDTTVALGSVEEWELANTDSDLMDHPFHIHTNNFQVIDRNGKPEPFRAWKDTIVVKGGETVRIRIPFRDFAGKTVYHCHILDHEDLGMMANLMIEKA